MSIRWVKSRLRAHGFWPRVYPINNGYGRITRAWVMRFQKARGLEVDGVVGPQTVGALRADRPSRERQRALKWANDAVGITEQPPGSNAGPRISKWQREAGYDGGNPGVAWCMCFAGCAVQHATRGRIKARQLGGYCPTIVAMGRSGSLGFQSVPLSRALLGDLVFFDFPGGEEADHVGLFVKSNGDGTFSSIEGNTSSGDSGSQSNGGGVYRRRRDLGLVSAVIRPPYK